jgi:hypothetical protein
MEILDLSLLRSRFQSGFYWRVSAEMLLVLLIDALLSAVLGYS